MFQSERDSFVKSRDWYRDQMHAAQESRSAIQHELISLQSESASKSNQIEKLKVELLGTNKTLEDEREKGLHEKEDMKRQLEELEVCFSFNLTQNMTNNFWKVLIAFASANVGLPIFIYRLF